MEAQTKLITYIISNKYIYIHHNKNKGIRFISKLFIASHKLKGAHCTVTYFLTCILLRQDPWFFF